MAVVIATPHPPLAPPLQSETKTGNRRNPPSRAFSLFFILLLVTAGCFFFFVVVFLLCFHPLVFFAPVCL